MRLNSGQWYGNTVSRHCIDGLTFSETMYGSSLELPGHSHEHAYFCLVLKGTYTESIFKREHICKTATLIFHPADETHSDRFHTAARCFNIQMDEVWMENMRKHSIILNEPEHFRGGELPLLAGRLYYEYCNADSFSSLIVEGIVL